MNGVAAPYPSPNYLYEINYVYSATEGQYRFGIWLEDWPYFEIDIQGILDPTKTSLRNLIKNKQHIKLYTEDVPMYDWETGYNVIYFNIVK